jgi:hypothetical protein
MRSLRSRTGGIFSLFSAKIRHSSFQFQTTFLSSRRRFVVAKPPEQKHILKRIIEMFLLSNFSASCRRQENKASFNPALYTAPEAQWPKATNLKAI